MKETVTPHRIESFAIHWASAAIEKKGVVSVPCCAVIVGNDGNRYRLQFYGQIITTQADNRLLMAYVHADRWILPDPVTPCRKLDEAWFKRSAFRGLIGYGPNAALRFPVERADDYLPAVVSEDGTRITAPSGWTVTVGFNPKNGWLKLTASLGGVTKCEITGDGLTPADISKLYIVPELTRRNLVAAAGAKWPDEPPAEAVN